MAYPAMLRLLPHGWLGVMLAGMLAAYISTIITHLNWGASYLVKDLYQRFLRPDQPERHYVNAGRLTSVLLMTIAGALTFVLETAAQSFQLLMSIGAGTGLLYLLRWFWWRINAWCEITAMASSFLVAFSFFIAGKQGIAIPSSIVLLTTIAVTTAVWVLTALVTAPTDSAVLLRQGPPRRSGVAGHPRRDRPATFRRFAPAGVPRVDARRAHGVRGTLRHRLPALWPHRHCGILAGDLRAERRVPGATAPRPLARPVRHMNLADTAVILARGLGSRMRHEDDTTTLDPLQLQAAAAGLKSMIPDAAGRPFLDHILSSLADAGVVRVVLVVAPDASVIPAHYAAHPPRRVSLEWAVQTEARGTADAVLSAESQVRGRPFLVLNADNLYPVAAIRALVSLGEPGLIAFDREALVRDGNINANRVAAFALLELDSQGYLVRLVEKPDAATARSFGGTWVSMNLWRFDDEIFAACRDVPLSVRGEHELPQAVMLAVHRGARLRAVTMHAGVLDLSSRGDIVAVANRLGLEHPRP
jgi:glucose-1-phosphate thymidylyltransferase